MISLNKIPHTPPTITHINKSVSQHIGATTNIQNTFSDIMDSAIDNYLASGYKSVISKLSFRKFLNKSLAQIMTPENFLNNGRESKVYKISDKYVARVKRGKYENDAIHYYDLIKDSNKKFRELNIYYGEPVIKVGDVEVLKNATPRDYVTCGLLWKGAYPKPEEIVKYYQEYIPACSSVPQEGYDEFAKCLKSLNEIQDKNHNIFRSLKRQNKIDSEYQQNKNISYTLDTLNPNNVLIADGSFKLVDHFAKVPFDKPNSVYTMIEPLLTRMTPDNLAEFNADSVIPRRNILRKILIASEKSELPFGSPLADETIDYSLSQLCADEKKGIKSPLGIFSVLKNMRKESVPLKERIAFINKELLEK